MTIEIRAYDHGKKDGFGAISARFFRACQGLASVTPHLADWKGDAGGVEIPVATTEDADAVVGAAARMWMLGAEELAAYGPSARSGASGRVAMVGGVPPIDLPAWVPNQMIATIDGAAEVELRTDPKLLVACLEKIVVAAEPAWAVVSSDDFPTAPVPPFADGSPAVGWYTWLSSKFPPLPAVLPEGATSRELAGGVLLVAHPTRADRLAIERLDAALRAAKVLLSARDWRAAK